MKSWPTIEPYSFRPAEGRALRRRGNQRS